jgi:hypothetical protein
VSGAELKEEYLRTISDAGFAEVEVVGETTFGTDFVAGFVDAPGEGLADIVSSVVSVKVRGVKPTSGE